MAADVVEANRLGLVDQQAEDTPAFRRRPDACTRLIVHTRGDESDQIMFGPPHAQRAVARIHQFCRGANDRLEGGVEFQPGGDGQHRVHQAVESVPALDDLMDAVLNLDE